VCPFVHHCAPSTFSVYIIIILFFEVKNMIRNVSRKVAIIAVLSHQRRHCAAPRVPPPPAAAAGMDASSSPAEPSLSTSSASGFSLGRGPSGVSWRASLFSSWQNGLVTAFGGCCAVAGIAFLIWKPFKQDSVHQTAAVASEALGDVKVRGQAVTLSKEVVESVLKDPKSVELLVEVVTSLLQKKDTQKAVTSFIQSVFADEYTQAISRKFVVDIIDSSYVREQLETIAYDLVVELLKNPKLRVSLSELLLESTSDALKDKKLHATTGVAMRHAAYYLLPFTSPPPPSTGDGE
jgi:hypothetical protein